MGKVFIIKHVPGCCFQLFFPIKEGREKKKKTHKWHEMVTSYPTDCFKVSFERPCVPCSCYHHLVLCFQVCLSCLFIKKMGDCLLNTRIYHSTQKFVLQYIRKTTAKCSCSPPTPPYHHGKQCSLYSKLFHVSSLISYYCKGWVFWTCQVSLITTLRVTTIVILFLSDEKVEGQRS